MAHVVVRTGVDAARHVETDLTDVVHVVDVFKFLVDLLAMFSVLALADCRNQAGAYDHVGQVPMLGVPDRYSFSDSSKSPCFTSASTRFW